MASQERRTTGSNAVHGARPSPRGPRADARASAGANGASGIVAFAAARVRPRVRDAVRYSIHEYSMRIVCGKRHIRLYGMPRARPWFVAVCLAVSVVAAVARTRDSSPQLHRDPGDTCWGESHAWD